MEKIEENRIEKCMFIFAITLIVTIFIHNYYTNIYRFYQVYSLKDQQQFYLNLSMRPQEYIVLQLKTKNSYPEMRVLINGECYQTFGNNKILSIPVNHGDVVHIDGSMYDDEIMVEVVEASRNTNQEIVGQQINIHKDIILLSLFQF